MSSFVRAAFLVILFKIGVSDQYTNTTFPAGAQYQSRQGFRNCPTHSTDPSLSFNRINVTVLENRLKDSVVVRLNITSQKTTCVVRPSQLQAYFDLQYSTVGNRPVLLLVIKKTIPYHISSDGVIDFIVRTRVGRSSADIKKINLIHISIESLQMELVSVPSHQKIVYRKALNYSRIFQPRVTDVIYASSSKLVYRLETVDSKELEGFLNITPSSAIVYVQNTFRISKLRNTKTRISIRIFVEDTLLGKQWKFEDTVKLKGEVRKEHCGSQSCSNSEHNTRDLCTGRCGLGAKESGCIWTVADNFITCSSDPKTCPDDTCDELERMDFNICPQDCVGEYFCFGKKKFTSQSRTERFMRLLLIIFVFLIPIVFFYPCKC
ncbi:proto-oncogene tyrosine-protein kinase receptor Ret-like [Anneissia japonica]|uniref:proto-oncogene tyrosine-protein kinase receptor Ret-like n=1 Tax=Anneissia japonica TaxID=1529436 RepID=UPI0014257263|nr:proto-oncogene tyrosine-protein kinase receptor Ret-like [Anneissia japonica]